MGGYITVSVDVDFDDVWDSLNEVDKKNMVRQYGNSKIDGIIRRVKINEDQGGHTRELIVVIEELIARSSSHLELSKKLESL